MIKEEKCNKGDNENNEELDTNNKEINNNYNRVEDLFEKMSILRYSKYILKSKVKVNLIQQIYS